MRTVQSLTMSIAALAIGCSAPMPSKGDAATTPSDAAALMLTSSAFADRGMLPVDYTCDGAGRSPPLTWSGAPGNTVELALLMTTNAKDGLKWNWVLWGIPANISALPDNAMGIGTAGLTSDGPKLAYSPPCSKGPGLMSYTLTLYALSGKPALPAQPSQVTGQVLTDAITGLTIASGAITVGYTR